ncbi:MAG: hypothetical protein ACI9YR_001019, partial [Bacteroidia bacterium]
AASTILTYHNVSKCIKIPVKQDFSGKLDFHNASTPIRTHR